MEQRTTNDDMVWDVAQFRSGSVKCLNKWESIKVTCPIKSSPKPFTSKIDVISSTPFGAGKTDKLYAEGIESLIMPCIEIQHRGVVLVMQQGIESHVGYGS